MSKGKGHKELRESAYEQSVRRQQECTQAITQSADECPLREAIAIILRQLSTDMRRVDLLINLFQSYHETKCAECLVVIGEPLGRPDEHGDYGLPPDASQRFM